MLILFQQHDQQARYEPSVFNNNDPTRCHMSFAPKQLYKVCDHCGYRRRTKPLSDCLMLCRRCGSPRVRYVTLEANALKRLLVLVFKRRD
jgi:hypothetical protein